MRVCVHVFMCVCAFTYVCGVYVFVSVACVFLCLCDYMLALICVMHRRCLVDLHILEGALLMFVPDIIFILPTAQQMHSD